MLYEFNGGDSCITRYILKMDMFFNVDSIQKDENLARDSTKE